MYVYHKQDNCFSQPFGLIFKKKSVEAIDVITVKLINEKHYNQIVFP